MKTNLLTRRSAVPALVLALGLAALPVSACFSEKDGPTTPPAGDCRVEADVPPGGGPFFVVQIRDFAFHPQTVRVAPGTTVVWVNCEPPELDGDPHTSTSDDGVWSSELLGVGDSYTRRFDAAGSFGYHCAPHPFMKGTIIVE